MLLCMKKECINIPVNLSLSWSTSWFYKMCSITFVFHFNASRNRQSQNYFLTFYWNLWCLSFNNFFISNHALFHLLTPLSPPQFNKKIFTLKWKRRRWKYKNNITYIFAHNSHHTTLQRKCHREGVNVEFF